MDANSTTSRYTIPSRRGRRSDRLLLAGVAAAPRHHGRRSTRLSRARTRPAVSILARPDTYVSAWDAVGTQAFTAAALTPAEGHVIFGYAGIAVYDAVMAVQRTYEPFAIRTTRPAGCVARGRGGRGRPPDLRALPPGPGGHDPRPGVRRVPGHHPRRAGEGPTVSPWDVRVANALIALRADDGFRADVGYTPPSPPVPGDWVPTAPTPPRRDVPRPDATRSPWSPPTSSDRTDLPHWAAGAGLATTTRSRRSARGRARPATDWQTTAALFWAEPPVQQAHLALRGVITQHELDIGQAARMMAMVSVAYADGIIACYDAKYAYEFWRPITAIRAGDTDGNDATVGDPTWSPLLRRARRTTPTTRAPTRASRLLAAEALAGFLGTRRIDLTMPSLTGLGRPALRHGAGPRPARSARPGSGAASTSAQPSRTASRIARQVAARGAATTTSRRSGADRPAEGAPQLVGAHARSPGLTSNA